MAINKELIKIELTEGLQQVGEISVEGRTATFKVKGLTPGSGTITAKYRDNGSPVTEEVTVVNIPTPGNLTTSKNTVETGEKVKLTQEFNVAPELGDVEFVLPPDVTEVHESKKLEGNNVTVEVNISTKGDHVIKTKYKKVETGKQVKVTGVDPEIQTVVANPDNIDEGQETTATITFSNIV